MKNIRKFKNFNESVENMTLSMEDVRNLGHNLGDRGIDFMQNYGWSEDTKLYIKDEVCGETWNGKKVVVYGYNDGDDLHYDNILGYAVSIDGDIKYLIGIYEPNGCVLNDKRGLLTCWGHEEIINLWLDNGEFQSMYTR
jgi:hypothetical protein